ncbi:MAG: hydrogenase formation protein HypD [Armatimonadota bacterium]|jgi:hydrogenase expression/formation protein HypD
MRYGEAFRDKEAAGALVQRIAAAAQRPTRLMEVCGTHTMALFQHGIRGLMPEAITLLSGPGCPVCVTPRAEVDAAIALARMEDVTLATFGDMMRVPGSETSLTDEGASGRRIEVVYSPTDALAIARRDSDRQVVFLGVGFETTAPSVACTILDAAQHGIANFSVLCVHKVIPPALRALLSAEDVRVDGFLCPGHVSTIIGSRPYEFISEQFGVPCAIAGFEPLDILHGILLLAEIVSAGEARVEIGYTRAVRPEGNPAALEHIERVFEPADAEWRGLGWIDDSGLAIRPELEAHDAARRFESVIAETKARSAAVADPLGCICGEVLRGTHTPLDCPHFGKSCTPQDPVGPCMVSSEGTCAAHYRYGDARDAD